MIRVTGSESKSNTGKPCCCHYVALSNNLSSDRGAEESDGDSEHGSFQSASERPKVSHISLEGFTVAVHFL